MKKRIKLVVLSAAFLSLNLLAQKKVEITPFYGYMLNSDVNTYYYGSHNVSNNDNFGGLFSVELYQNGWAEFMYNRTDGDFTYSYQGSNPKKIGLAQEYYQIGTLKQLDVSEVVKGFGTASLGATRFVFKDAVDLDGTGTDPETEIDDKWAFSATLGAGLKIFLSDKVGLRLQARMLLPMQFNGIFVGVGTGGASGGASFHVPMVSGDFTAGLILRLGE